MKGGNGSHWEDCWKSHIDCAEVKIASLTAALATAEDALLVADEALKFCENDYAYMGEPAQGQLLKLINNALAKIEKARGKV